MITVVWHTVYLVVSAPRAASSCATCCPTWRTSPSSGSASSTTSAGGGKSPRFGRFSYVEKAEYWALIWGSAVMVVTGLLLWFDNWFIQFLPKGVLDVALVIHYWEAWLATLAILVWHLYSTVFNPHVYPMNPSWLTGSMPEEMYRHEHPEHLEEARRETEEHVRRELDHLRAMNGEDADPEVGKDDGTA